MASFLRLLCVLCFLSMSACTNLSTLLFYPDKNYYRTPEALNIPFETITLTTEDGKNLRNWLIKPRAKPKATVLFLHGNGENISTHLGSVAWLTEHKYSVFLLDYRGYGKSTGESTLETAISDTALAHRWLSEERSEEIIILGQSMGGAIAITYLSMLNDALKNDALDYEVRPAKALITESAPANWPQIAREAMSKHWLTWLLQGPASLLPYQYNAEDHVHNIPQMPVLMMHSPDDQIVPYHHLAQILANAPEDTQSIQTSGKHIAGMADGEIRNSVLEFIEAAL